MKGTCGCDACLEAWDRGGAVASSAAQATVTKNAGVGETDPLQNLP